jgi:hypothetical protein
MARRAWYIYCCVYTPTVKHCVVTTSAGKVARRDGLQVWQIGFANGHLRKIKERRKDDTRINENYQG